MDTAQATTHVSLCAGYGGIDLGLKRAITSLRTIAFSEIEAFAVANLVAKMEAGLLDAAPVWTNLKTFPWESFRGCVDILSGGYPCQPFSAAGKRLGAGDPRHLWPFIADGISRMQPSVCFFENVEGHVSLGLRDVLNDLRALGYSVEDSSEEETWGLFSAAEVGAPHQRKRVFILAYRNDAGLEGWDRRIVPERSGEWAAWPSRPSVQQHGWEPPRVVADSQRLREPQPSGGKCDERGRIGDGGEAVANGCRSRLQEERELWQGKPNVARPCDSEWRQTQPTLGGDANGPADWMDDAQLHISTDNRTDELRLLGNGVVPATAERAFRVLSSRLGLKQTNQHQ